MKSNKKFKRKCISCGEYKNKEDLIKITKTAEGEIVLNPNNKQLGRSIYICKSEECVKNAVKNKKINKFLKTQIPTEILNQLQLF